MRKMWRVTRPSPARPDLAAMLYPLINALIAAELPVLAAHGVSMWGYTVLNALDGVNVTYTHNVAAGTLTRLKGGDSRMLLKGIASLTFSLYQRPSNPSAPYEQFPSATPATAKLVAFQWSCARTVAGPQNNSESIEMAMVELRNQ